MDEALKKLLSSEVLSEETKKALTAAFQNSIKLVEAEAEKRVRGELVQQFKDSEKDLHEAMEKWMASEIAPHVKELKEGTEEVAAMKKTLAERASGIEKALKTEYTKRVNVIESAVEQIIKKEMSELHDDVRTNRRAYLSAINESKTRYARMEEELKKKTALVLEMFLEKTVKDMLGELRNEIKAANEADFGREIFEAFNSVYRRHFFNTNTEVRDLAAKTKALSESNVKIKIEAKKRVDEAVQQAAIATAAHKKLTESVALARTRTHLLSTLKGDARNKMRTVLESCTSVDAMKRNFSKFLPEFLNEGTVPSQKKTITEKTIRLRTGDSQESKPSLTEEVEVEDSDLVDIRRLAGMGR